MGRMLPVLIHANLLQRLIHPLTDGRACNAQVLRAESHILLHHIGHDLVVRILENHAHAATNGDQQFFIGGVHTGHIHLTAGGQQNGVEMLGKGGLSAAVAAKHRYESPLFNC